MSNFIKGKIHFTNVYKSLNPDLFVDISSYATKNGFAISFHTTDLSERVIDFVISDSLSVEYCEYFMEPVIFSTDGAPLLANILKDSDLLCKVVNKMLKLDCVGSIELRFSWTDISWNNEEVFMVEKGDLQRFIMKKFLSEYGFPSFNVVVSSKI